MSCKEKPYLPSKNKHYTLLERKVFLQILNDYKHIIENKKNNSATLKEKEVTWNEISNKFNQSTLISQERTVAHLKKLWTNLKQSQREALTKEKQSRMATGSTSICASGGGPPEVQIDVDPDVATIAPHLMKTAPVSFSSNMTDEEINHNRDFVFEIMSSNEDIAAVLNSDNEDSLNTHINMESSQDPSISARKDDILIASCREEQKDVPKEESLDILHNEKVKQTHSLKRKRNTIKEGELSNTEETLCIKRITQVIVQEQQLACTKQKHEENISNMKENHLKEIYNLELQHLRQIQALEIELKKAQLKAVTSKKDKENINTF